MENQEFHNSFLDGNELIEEAIAQYRAHRDKADPMAVVRAIRERMHADGHFVSPIIRDEDDPDSFAFRSLSSKDGKIWQVAFTSQAEADKGQKSEYISHFIDSVLKFSLESKADGVIINPWGEAYLMPKEQIELLFEMDKGVEYSVPDVDITEELLEDGSFLKKATEICNRNRTKLNMIKLCRILRDSWIWVPCQAIMGEMDEDTFSKMVAEAAEKGDLDSLVGREFVSHDQIRLVPDILQNGDDFFFPVFTSAEEMGEYGNGFSKVQKHFLEAAALARNNEKDVKGIVINAFSEPFVVSKELFDLIAGMDSSIDSEEQEDE